MIGSHLGNSGNKKLCMLQKSPRTMTVFYISYTREKEGKKEKNQSVGMMVMETLPFFLPESM
jgi:hypothetical protein